MKNRTKRTIFAPCPGCHKDIFVDHTPILGEFVTCPECGDLVEVVNLSPLTLDWSTDVGDEEWPDYWDDDDGLSADYSDDNVSVFD
jgi:lysine biosynthesis protein LysW